MRRDSPSLDKLLENPRLWRGHNQSHVTPGLASGYEALDRHLPGGGWPQCSLTEILVEHYGIGELRLLMPALLVSRTGIVVRYLRCRVVVARCTG